MRRRMLAVHEQILAGVLRAVTLEASRREGFRVSRALAARLARWCCRGPDGEGRGARPPSPPPWPAVESGDVAGALQPLAAG